MRKIGIDIGASTIKLVVFEDGKLVTSWMKRHHASIRPAVLEALSQLKTDETVFLSVTGSQAGLLCEALGTTPMGEIPAITEGVRYLVPEAGSIVEIGSQNSRFITDLQKTAPRFSVNEHCAGGTGSFFEDQMQRLGLHIEQYSAECAKASSVPRLSGRCSVFAKTDIIHRQQEGCSTPDILLGLCYAMIRNFKAVIVRDLPVTKPVVFCGGVTENQGVIRAMKEIFKLKDDDLILPEQALYASAIGAALHAETAVEVSALLTQLREMPGDDFASASGPLLLPEGLMQPEPTGTEQIPATGCALGIDIGSTSTDLVLVAPDGTLIHHQYLRTGGSPEEAVRHGLNIIREKFGDLNFLATGITGSGRQRLGKLMGVDAIRDEITAQARAAAALDAQVDTVFEIGGQDSKFISIQSGEVADFQMNKICAAGTGSFIEEQASRMDIPLQNFGPLALTAQHPLELGERCTVFIETAMASAGANGQSQADIAAGLCQAIVKNYLHKVVGSKHIGQHIVLQGGVAYNPGIVAAFSQMFGPRLTVSPYFPISGAYGAALLALEAMDGRTSTFRGLDGSAEVLSDETAAKEVQENTRFYQRSSKLLLADYDGTLDPRKKTVGIPYVLMIHKFFPLANAFFKSLGYNVLLTKPTNEETIRLSQEYAQGETCYPVKLIYGHMQQLIEQKVDYIFLPSVRTMKHEASKVENNYGCVYMQTATRSIASALGLEKQGIELLNPVFDLDFGKKAMAGAMLELGKQLGKPKVLCMKALMAGAMAVRRHTEAVEKQGKTMLQSLKPEDKVLVLITRNYGLSDPVLNMGIPDLLLERGYKIMTLSHLPAHDLDLSDDYPNIYWPFGQHILSGVKMVAHHPNLYAVCLNNHGCGPDTMLSQLIRTEMGNKPWLQLEVDEHFSAVGVITRVEAFLNSLSHRKTEVLPDHFDIKAVSMERVNMQETPAKELPLYLPPLGKYTQWLGRYYQQTYDVHTAPMVWEGVRQIDLGRAETNSKEYLPFPALLDAALKTVQHDAEAQLLLPSTEGAEADGVYARAIRSVLDRKGYCKATVVSPMLETMDTAAKFPELLLRALTAGDLQYLGAAFSESDIPEWEALRAAAAKLKGASTVSKRIGVVGTPMSLTSLDDGILDELKEQQYTVIRQSMAEYLLFLWSDRAKEAAQKKRLAQMAKELSSLGAILGSLSPFSAHPEQLQAAADAAFPRFAGANGRYRWAKALALSQSCDAVLTLSPRYENTAVVLEMRGLSNACTSPLFAIALDGDWDESSRSRLQSFLYYC